LFPLSGNKSHIRRGSPSSAGIAALTALLIGCGSSTSSSTADRAHAIAAAKRAYALAVRRGETLARGPCIADRLPGLSDWVADVAHDPRRPVDALPANQCARYRAGEAHHFVELTPGGRVIRAQ
jgi:hypothetical protein